MDKPHLKYCGKKAQIELFLRLLSAVPELLEEITPDGFEQSIYHNIYHRTAVSAYRRYRLQRVRNYLMIKLFKGERRYTPLNTFHEFSRHYKADRLNVPLELLNILSGVMGAIFCIEYYIVYDHQGKRYDLTFYNDFEDCFRTAANRTEFFSGQRFTVDAIFEREPYSDTVDLSPIRRFIFRKLKQWNLNLFYDQEGSPVMRQFQEDLQQMMNLGQKAPNHMDYDPVAAFLQGAAFKCRAN